MASEVKDTLADIEALNEELFALRTSLMRSNEKVELPAGFGTTRKRKRGDGAEREYVSATIKDLKTIEDA